jgi:hypothetical protein
MNSKFLIWVALGLAVMGCSGKKSQFESQFIGGCVGPDGGSEQKKICSCIADKLEARYSIDDLFLLAEQRPRQLLQEAASYAPSCGARS